MSCEQYGPPKSLRGSQDAEAIWAIVVQRFPTAAPLICEMEAVIDRAEDLLQKLRAPLQPGRPSSPDPAESKESLALLSARDSFEQEPISGPVEENVAEGSETELEPSLDSLKSDTLELCEALSSDGQVATSSLDMGDHKLESSDTETLSAPLQGSGDEAALKFEGPSRPWGILEAYANRCKVPLAYPDVDARFQKMSLTTPRFHKICAKLGGYGETSVGTTKLAAKNSVAVKLLAKIANKQMNDEQLGLPELNREELLHIIELAPGDISDDPRSKLYRLCLDKNQDPPKYLVKKEQTCRGTTFTATCNALGVCVDGEGHGLIAAKKAAAEKAVASVVGVIGISTCSSFPRCRSLDSPRISS